MEEVARNYAEALFAVGREQSKLDAFREQLGQFEEAVGGSDELSLFLFSPYFSSEEKREGLERAISGAEPEIANFLALLAEKHRMPLLGRIRRRFEELWSEENREIQVTLTSAIPLDEAIVERIGSAVEKQTERTARISSVVDGDILGGIVLRVGNMVLDASLRTKLERLRREVAQAA